MFTKAVLDGIRAQHKRFADRMKRDGLKPLGFLGGRENEPRIADYELETTARGRVLRLHVRFPARSDTDVLKEDDHVLRIIPLPVDADDRPAHGTTFSVQVNAQVFTGTVCHRGDMFHIDYTVA